MKNVVLFDMDGTLTPARKEMSRDILDALLLLLEYADIGIVSGSPFEYIQQQCRLLFEVTNHAALGDLLILPCNGTQKYAWKNEKWEREFSLEMRDFVGEEVYDHTLHSLLERQYICSLTSNAHRYPLTGHFISYTGVRC